MNVLVNAPHLCQSYVKKAIAFCFYADNIYTVSLKEGLNSIFVRLKENNKRDNVYSLYITRYGMSTPPVAPKENEVSVTVFLSDGVNGSHVDETYLRVYETGNSKSKSEVLVRNGKAIINLEKNKFYDFKALGRKAPCAEPYYAASDVIYYYIGDINCEVSVV